jgi:hypothetical protein
MIIDFTGYLNTFFSLDVNLENITTRLSVLTFIITGLDDKLNWFTNSLFLKDTRAESKGFVGTGVKEIGVVNISSGKFITKNAELNSALLGAESLKVRGDSSDLSLANESTANIHSVFGGCISGNFTNGEVNLDALVFKALTLDVDWDTTGKLTKRWVNFGDGIAWTDNLVDCEGI